MAINGFIIVNDYKEIKELIYEVNKIGNNINQIAREINTTSFIKNEDINYIRNKLDEIYKLISDKI